MSAFGGASPAHESHRQSADVSGNRLDNALAEYMAKGGTIKKIAYREPAQKLDKKGRPVPEHQWLPATMKYCRNTDNQCSGSCTCG